MIEYQRIGEASYKLGEGPLWDPESGRLYWLDLLAPAVWWCDLASGAIDGRPLPAEVAGSMAIRAGGDALIALNRSFVSFDLATGACETLLEAEPEDSPTNFNDGKADRRGRFVVGSSDLKLKSPLGSLYCLYPDFTLERIDEGIICSNGPCWSPDDQVFYFADTMRHAIYAYDYDIDTGRTKNRRVFIDTTSYKATPDGQTVDAEGYLWTTFTETGVIARFAPDGRLDRLIETPIEMVTSVMFGGDGLDTLFVTSLGDKIGDLRPSRPDAGGVYAVTGLGVKGVPETRFAG